MATTKKSRIPIGIEPFVATALAEPGTLPLLVLADFLEDACEDRHARRIRHWCACQDELRSLFFDEAAPQGNNWETKLPIMAASPRRLLLHAGWHAVQSKWPVEWDKVTAWTDSWSGKQMQANIASTWRTIELVALGLAPTQKLKAARYAAVAAWYAAVAAQHAAGVARHAAGAAWYAAVAAQHAGGAARYTGGEAWNAVISGYQRLLAWPKWGQLR